jgi:hypothetical protein
MFSNRRARSCRVALLLSASLALAACGEDASTPAPRASVKPPATSAEPRVELKDVLETTPTHIIGISYPPGLSRYPGLAAQARRYAEDARASVVEAIREQPADAAEAPFELSLEFKLKHESPRMVVLAVDGSSYTGGAHGMPLIQRWVWLPPENRLLTAADLFPRPDSWKVISAEVRGQLGAELARRVEADGMEASKRAEAVRTAGAMLEGGAVARPEDFAMFEPVFNGGGKISALRFVFPPYQVGTYADGMHTVELPAARLVQHVAPAYRTLFEAA